MKEEKKIFIPYAEFDEEKEAGMLFKFSGLVLKGVPILEPNDVRDRGENVRIKIDIGNEQVLWFIPKRDIVFFKEFFDGLYKIFLKEKK
jgi:hypothetical protein